MIDLPLKEISAIVGKANLLLKPEALEPYSHDAAPLFKAMPAAVARVRTSIQISALMKLASRLEFPVVPRGQERD